MTVAETDRPCFHFSGVSNRFFARTIEKWNYFVQCARIAHQIKPDNTFTAFAVRWQDKYDAWNDAIILAILILLAQKGQSIYSDSFIVSLAQAFFPIYSSFLKLLRRSDRYGRGLLQKIFSYQPNSKRNGIKHLAICMLDFAS